MSLAAYRDVSVNAIPRPMWPSASYATLVILIGQADRSIERDDVPAAHEALMRAQEIVHILHASLRPEGGELSERLAALYAYVADELVEANLKKDRGRLRRLLDGVVLPLREAWDEAGRVAVQGGAASGRQASA